MVTFSGGSVLGELAKKRWWSKRAHYMKLRNTKTKSGQGVDEKTQKWKWWDYLEFLKPYHNNDRYVDHSDQLYITA